MSLQGIEPQILVATGELLRTLSSVILYKMFIFDRSPVFCWDQQCRKCRVCNKRRKSPLTKLIFVERSESEFAVLSASDMCCQYKTPLVQWNK